MSEERKKLCDRLEDLKKKLGEISRNHPHFHYLKKQYIDTQAELEKLKAENRAKESPKPDGNVRFELFYNTARQLLSRSTFETIEAKVDLMLKNRANKNKRFI